MKLLNKKNFYNFYNMKGSAVTIGNFDGVHKGHQELLKQLNKEAKKLQLPTIVLLFEPQPNEYFGNKNQYKILRITNLRTKLFILKQFNIDYVFYIKFNLQCSLMSAEQFIEYYIFSILQTKYLLIGEDFKFGFNKSGNIILLKSIFKKKDCFLSIFPSFPNHNDRISSTKIRKHLILGNFKQANYLLGRNYSIFGRVVKGNGNGMIWGIPTANLIFSKFSSFLHGVFIVRVKRYSNLEKTLYGVANFGTRPTICGKKFFLEIHIFDFHYNIYGEILEIFFINKIRNEIKFSSVYELIRQIKQDIQLAKYKLNIIS